MPHEAVQSCLTEASLPCALHGSLHPGERGPQVSTPCKLPYCPAGLEVLHALQFQLLPVAVWTLWLVHDWRMHNKPPPQPECFFICQLSIVFSSFRIWLITPEWGQVQLML